MNNTQSILDATRVAYGVSSDYKLADSLGVTTSVVYHWRAGKGYPSDENALQIAQILDVDPLYVMAVFHREREPNARIKRTWARLARVAKRGLAAVYIIILGSASMAPSPAAVSLQAAQAQVTIYTLYALRRRLRRARRWCWARVNCKNRTIENCHGMAIFTARHRHVAVAV